MATTQTETVIGTGLDNTINDPPLTTAQINAIANDVMRFYSDAASLRSTSADLSKLTSDVSGLNLTQDSLGQTLASELQRDAGPNAGTLGADLARIYYPKIASDLSQNGKGLPNDLTALAAETRLVGAAYSTLAHNVGAPLALTGAVSLFKLA